MKKENSLKVKVSLPKGEIEKIKKRKLIETDFEDEPPNKKRKKRKTISKGEVLEFMQKIYSFDSENQIFYFPVPIDTPSYYDVIKNPMDFSTIKGKIEQNEYVIFDEFWSDLKTTFKNAIKFNVVGSIFYNEAKRIMKLVNDLFKNIDPKSKIKTDVTPKVEEPEIGENSKKLILHVKKLIK